MVLKRIREIKDKEKKKQNDRERERERDLKKTTNIWYSAVGVILGICDLYFEARGHAITAEDAVAWKDSIVSLKPIQQRGAKFC